MSRNVFFLPAPLFKPTAEYINSIVLLRGTFPVDLYVTSSVLTVRDTPSLPGVFGEEACEEALLASVLATLLVSMDGDGEGAFLVCGLFDVWRTTSSFHFFTTAFALIDSWLSLCVLNFPITLPISVFYKNIIQ